MDGFKEGTERVGRGASTARCGPGFYVGEVETTTWFGGAPAAYIAFPTRTGATRWRCRESRLAMKSSPDSVRLWRCWPSSTNACPEIRAAGTCACTAASSRPGGRVAGRRDARDVWGAVLRSQASGSWSALFVASLGYDATEPSARSKVGMFAA